MKKENKIDMLLAFLSSVMWKGITKTEDTPSPYVCFLSSKEIQMAESDGCIPTNKVFENNPLKDLLETIVKTYFAKEELHWLESWGTDNPESDYTEIEAIYDSTYCPEHIYHQLRILKELIS